MGECIARDSSGMMRLPARPGIGSACDRRSDPRNGAVSSSPARGHRWVRWLGGIGLLALVIFPWSYALLVPPEARFREVGVGWLVIVFQVVGIAYLAGFLVIFVHESGHWLFGRLVGIRISDFVVGTGANPVEFTCGGIRFSFGPWLRWGYVHEIPARANLHFGKQFVFLSGGMLAEVIFLIALVLVPASDAAVDPVTQAFASFRRIAFICGVFGIWASAWPRRVSMEGRLTPNDALLIQQAWANRGRADELWQQQQWLDEVFALSQAGKYAEAKTVLQQLIEAGPENAEHRSLLAALQEAVEDWDRAMHAHHESIQQTEPRSEARAHAVDAAATLALQLGRRDELARLRPLVEEVLENAARPTIAGTLGGILVELDEIEAGVKWLNQCLATTQEDHDRAIANAYLAKAELRRGRTPRAAEHLRLAQAKEGDHPLVRRLVQELEPDLRAAGAPDATAR